MQTSRGSSAILKGSAVRTVLGALAVSTVGCGGGGSNNDQGTSFSLIGFNSVENNLCQNGIFISSVNLPLSQGTGTETTGNAGVYTCMTLHNNLATQGVRADRVLLEYIVPGATQQPPSTTTAVSGIFGPSNGQAAGDPSGGAGGNNTGNNNTGPTPPTSSLPPGFTRRNEGTVGFSVVPPAVTEWMALNRSALPEPPFQMTARVKVSAVTTAGDRIETNQSDLLVAVLPDNVIAPGTGDDTAAAEGTAEVSEEEAAAE